MSEDRLKELNKLNKNQLCEKVIQLEDENAALKLVDGVVAVEAAAPPRESLSEADRTFEVKIDKKKVKALLKDVSKIYLSGNKYSQEEFMASEELQEQAVEMKHTHIKILK